MANNEVYIEVTTTNGNTLAAWIDIDGMDSWQEVTEAFQERHPKACLCHAEMLVHDTQGDLARAFAGRYGSFDINGFGEAQPVAYALCGDGEAAIAAYIDHFGDWSAERFEEAWQGAWESEEDYAEQLADDMGLLDSMPENLRGYFDWAAWTRDLFLDGYAYVDGFVFTTY